MSAALVSRINTEVVATRFAGVALLYFKTPDNDHQSRTLGTQRLWEYERYRALVDSQLRAVNANFEKVVSELKKLPRPKKPKPAKP